MSDQYVLTSCKRVTMLPPIVEPSQAFIFVELVKSKVPRNQALRFAQRVHCQYDSSKRVDGPPNYRIIKSYADPHAVKVNGWMSDRPIVTNDPLQLDLRRIDQQKDWMDKVLTPKLSDRVSNSKIEEENIVKIRRFYQNLEQKCNLKDLSPHSKIAKIRALNINSRKKKENLDTETKMSIHLPERNAEKDCAKGKKPTALHQIDEIKINPNSLNMRFQQHCRSVRHLDNSKLALQVPIKEWRINSKHLRLRRALLNSDSDTSESTFGLSKKKVPLIDPPDSTVFRFPMTERLTKKAII